jgi:RNA polymerase sigma-70 factor (ECF subfamily)
VALTRRLGVPESDLADGTHDVFVVVHRKLAEFEARSKLTTWLYAICLRTASDRRRSSQATREVVVDRIEAVSSEQDASAIVERRQALALLDELLAEMPIEQRTVFTCFELDGMGGDEIADLLGIPLGTVFPATFGPQHLSTQRHTTSRARTIPRAREQEPVNECSQAMDR